MVRIINYGSGNVGSLYNMLKRAGIDANLVSDADCLQEGDRFILPGVGSFDACMSKLRDSGFIEVLEELVMKKGSYVLGICVGMQMLFQSSEEGACKGLGWVQGKVQKFDPLAAAVPVKIPHMGWNQIHPSKPSLLLEGLEQGARFYFVHSYYACPADARDILMQADHGIRFTAAIQHDNIFGVQFHPEKSHRYGMQLLKNFALLP